MQPVVMFSVSPLNRFSGVHLLSSSLSLAAITAAHVLLAQSNQGGFVKHWT